MRAPQPSSESIGETKFNIGKTATAAAAAAAAARTTTTTKCRLCKRLFIAAIDKKKEDDR